MIKSVDMENADYAVRGHFRRVPSLFLVLEYRDCRNRRTGRFAVTCIGRKRHYRKDGSCKHVAAFMDQVKEKYLGRVYLTPFGGPAEATKVRLVARPRLSSTSRTTPPPQPAATSSA